MKLLNVHRGRLRWSRAPAAATALAMPTGFSDWSQATRVEAQAGTDPAFNGPALDGCPNIARDDETLYMASNRPGGLGGIDIWVARRETPDDPWGAPENLGAPVNSSANDFCPTIDRNERTLFFVSNRAGGCGGADIYVTRHRPDGWDDPRNVGCDVNSAADEASPSPLPEPGSGKVLYFSSVRPGGFAPDAAGATIGDSDLYVSQRHGGVLPGRRQLVPGVNTAFEDGQPNVRRDGLEIFFFSQPPGHARHGRHLRGDARSDVASVVGAVQPRPRASTAPTAPRRGRRSRGTARRSTSAPPAPAVTARPTTT